MGTCCSKDDTKKPEQKPPPQQQQQQQQQPQPQQTPFLSPSVPQTAPDTDTLAGFAPNGFPHVPPLQKIISSPIPRDTLFPPSAPIPPSEDSHPNSDDVPLSTVRTITPSERTAATPTTLDGVSFYTAHSPRDAPRRFSRFTSGVSEPFGGSEAFQSCRSLSRVGAWTSSRAARSQITPSEGAFFSCRSIDTPRLAPLEMRFARHGSRPSATPSARSGAESLPPLAPSLFGGRPVGGSGPSRRVSRSATTESALFHSVVSLPSAVVDATPEEAAGRSHVLGGFPPRYAFSREGSFPSTTVSSATPSRVSRTHTGRAARDAPNAWTAQHVTQRAQSPASTVGLASVVSAAQTTGTPKTASPPAMAAPTGAHTPTIEEQHEEQEEEEEEKEEEEEEEEEQQQQQHEAEDEEQEEECVEIEEVRELETPGEINGEEMASQTTEVESKGTDESEEHTDRDTQRKGDHIVDGSFSENSGRRTGTTPTTSFSSSPKEEVEVEVK